MGRNVVAWALITLGLTGIVGGAGMAYIFSMGEGNARAHNDINPGAPPRQSESLLRYGSTALSGVVGLILLCWGLGLRGSGPRPRKPGPDRGPRRTCPSCGQPSPATALKCYHCGSGL